MDVVVNDDKGHRVQSFEFETRDMSEDIQRIEQDGCELSVETKTINGYNRRVEN